MIMVHFQEYMVVILEDIHVNYNRLNVVVDMNDEKYKDYLMMLRNEMDLNLIHYMTLKRIVNRMFKRKNSILQN
jgi:hypothetical protein